MIFFIRVEIHIVHSYTSNGIYDGTFCSTDIDDCADSPCDNGGTCIDKVADYDCNCVEGYSGKNCSTGK